MCKVGILLAILFFKLDVPPPKPKEISDITSGTDLLHERRHVVAHEGLNHCYKFVLVFLDGGGIGTEEGGLLCERGEMCVNIIRNGGRLRSGRKRLPGGGHVLFVHPVESLNAFALG